MLNVKELLEGSVYRTTSAYRSPMCDNKLYKLKRCSKKECLQQCRHVKFKGTMTILSQQKQTHRTAQKHAEHQDATDIQNEQKRKNTIINKEKS